MAHKQYSHLFTNTILLLLVHAEKLFFPIEKRAANPAAPCTCQEKVDTKKGKITGSPVRSCTELGFCSPRQQPDGDD